MADSTPEYSPSSWKPSHLIGDVMARVRAGEHSQFQAYLRRFPECPRRAANKVTQCLAHLPKVVQLDKVDACSRSPRGRVIRGTSPDIYDTLREVWRKRPGLIRVEAHTLVENKPGLLEAINATRSEALSAELILTGKALELTHKELDSWTSFSILKKNAGGLYSYYLALARYKTEHGKKIVVCLPVCGFWLASEEERRADRAVIIGELDALAAGCGRDRETLEVLGPLTRRTGQ